MSQNHIERFSRTYAAIKEYVSNQCNSNSLESVRMYVDEDDINFIHQIRVLYKKQGHPDSSAPKHHRLLSVRYALLMANQGLTPPLHDYKKKSVDGKIAIYETFNGIDGHKETLKGMTENEEDADQWIEENKNAIHDTTSNARKKKGLPNPIVKIISFKGDKVSLAFRKLSKGANAKYGWYEVNDIFFDAEKFISKSTSEGFDKRYAEGVFNYTNWESLLEPEKQGKGGQEDNPNLDPPHPDWLGQYRPKKRIGRKDHIQPGPKTVDYNGLSNYSKNDLKTLDYYNEIVHGTVEKNNQGEMELLSYIKNNYQGEVLHHYNDIDVYIPELKVGFDYHESLWHLETIVGRKHHWMKANKADKDGIRLIQIYEDEWINKSNITKSRIRCTIGKSTKIFARKTEIVNLTQNESTEFLQRTHIQGNYNSAISYGLTYEGKLVACMTFGISRFNKRYDSELLRYSSEIDTVIVGGASKLLRHFFKENGKVNLISYADRRWSAGNLYKQLGFNLDEITQPSHSYYNICKDKLLNRLKMHKKKLSKMFGYADHLTEQEIMLLNGFDRIWDAGQYRFSMNSMP